MKKTSLLLSLILGHICCSGQSATVKVERLFFENSYDKFDSIYFDINGIKFKGWDTLGRSIVLNETLDKCTAITGNDTLIFFAKFQNGQEYIIRPGCCCAAFTLQAKQNANRGTVTFKNMSGRNLGIVICEHNSDTVKKDSVHTIYADESAMCLFRPCHIQIVEPDFFSDEYEYRNDNRSYFRLWLERESHVLFKVWFHFLHGEKIEIISDGNPQNTVFKIVDHQSKG